MQYSPKLKIAMEEIKQIIAKHDIAGVVVLHTPGHGEYHLAISPTYSCARMEGPGMRIRARADDYGGDTKIRDKKLAETANMFSILSEITAHQALALIELSEKVDQATKAEHEKSNHTGHTTQNN